METTEVLKEIVMSEIPDELVSKIENDGTMYPRMHRYKTKEKIENRISKITDLMKRSKKPNMKAKYENELLALEGKNFALCLKDSGPFFNLFYLKWSMAEADVYKGMKKTEEDKKSFDKEMGRATATYYYMGKRLREKGLKVKC